MNVPSNHFAFTPARPARGGFTLLEALFGSVILAVSVLAMGMAVSAGQKASLDGQKAVLGAMAVDDLLAELNTVDYAALTTFHEFEQPVGEITAIDGAEYPASFWSIGRRAEIVEQEVNVEALGVKVRGMRIVVTAFDETRDVAAAEVFIPEPAQ